MRDGPRRVRLRVLLPTVFVAAVLVYLPALENGFLHWDDYTYVYRNPYMQPLGFGAVRWALTATYFSYWHPVTWLSHLLDYTLWGMDPRMHHLVNVLLHALNAVVVFVFTAVLLGAANKEPRNVAEPRPLTAIFAQPGIALGATFAALLFAIHPQHVEVVAWVSERKELLSTLFYVLALCVYVRYGSANDQSRRRPLLYATGLLFVLAVMSKPMAVTLPVTLLVLDMFPLRRLARAADLRHVLPEKIPFVLLSVCVIYATLVTQEQAGSIQSLHELSVGARVSNSFANSIFYLQKFLVPFDLAAFYPFPEFVRQFSWRTALPYGVFLLVSAACLWGVKRGRPGWAAVWLAYLVTLGPVIGLVHSGPQSAADRYAYLPTIGFYVLVGAAVSLLGAIAGTRPAALPRAVAGAIVCAMFFTLTGTTNRQIAVWYDDLTLWRSVVARFPGRSAFAHNNLGNAYFEQGDYPAALRHYEQTIELEPASRTTYDNMLATLWRGADDSEALAVLAGLVERYPRVALPLQTLAKYHSGRGRYDDALVFLHQAGAIDPGLPSVHFEMGRIRVAQNQHAQALRDFEQALALAPDYVDAMLALATLHQRAGQPDTALTHYVAAMSMAPDDTRAYYGLGELYGASGAYARAADVYELLLRIEPHDPAIYLQLAGLYTVDGRGPDAEQILLRGIRVNPFAAQLHRGLGEYYAQAARPDAARASLARAAQLEADATGRESRD